MATNPLSPTEFLTHLKSAEARPFSGSFSQEFIDIHLRDLQHHGIEKLNPENWFDSHFNELFNLIASTLPTETKTSLHSRVAVGCVDNREVNAYIIRSDCGNSYAILINRALLTMLNHCVKLIAASNHPSTVVFFEGLPIDPTGPPGRYSTRCTTMLKGYGKSGKPLGPELKLAVDSPATAFVEAALVALHLFVLAHEVGHYVNGDLDSVANFCASSEFHKRPLFGGANVSHVMEFAADRFAFEAVLRTLHARGAGDMLARRALDLSATLFFNFLRDISNRGSESHPRPSDRILAITRGFFGEEAAQLMKASFEDLSVIERFRDQVGTTTVSELLKARYGSNP